MLIKGYSQWLCLFYCVIDDETMVMSGQAGMVFVLSHLNTGDLFIVFSLPGIRNRTAY